MSGAGSATVINGTVTGGSGWAAYGAYAASGAGSVTVNAGDLIANAGLAAVIADSFVYNPTPSNYVRIGSSTFFAGGFPKARLTAGV